MNIDDFSKMLKGKSRLFSMPIETCLKKYKEEYERDAEMIFSFVEKLADNLGDEFEKVIDAYFDFVEGQAKLQKAFQKTGQYIYTTEKQVEEVIKNADYQKENLYTLALSYVLAPHRYGIFRFVKSAIRRFVKPGDGCLEVGTGNGLHSIIADSQGALVDTHDFNPYSSLCLKLLGASRRVRFFPKASSFEKEETYEHCMLVEVLEHLEDPLKCLLAAERVLKRNATATVTFALRMPQIDHIYLFNSVTDARDMIAKTRFKIIDHDCFISSFMHYDLSKTQILAESSEYAANFACVIRKV